MEMIVHCLANEKTLLTSWNSKRLIGGMCSDSLLSLVIYLASNQNERKFCDVEKESCLLAIFISFLTYKVISIVFKNEYICK